MQFEAGKLSGQHSQEEDWYVQGEGTPISMKRSSMLKICKPSAKLQLKTSSDLSEYLERIGESKSTPISPIDSPRETPKKLSAKSKRKSFSALDKVVSPLSMKIQAQITSIKRSDATEDEITIAIEEIKNLVTGGLSKNASANEKAKAIAKEFTRALKQIGLPNLSLKANRLVSLALGQTILQPKNIDGENEYVMSKINRGVVNPHGCAEDMWRTMERINIYSSISDTPLLDSKTIEKDGDGFPIGKDLSNNMKDALNLFYRHASGHSDSVLSSDECGNSQVEAGEVGKGLAQKLLKTGLGEQKIEPIQRMLGLSAQELFTEPGAEAIPIEFRQGVGDLIVSEFNPTLESKLVPLQYDRVISIILRNNGSLDYIAEQPITFKDKNTTEPLGSCRIRTTFLFNSTMDCILQKQEVRIAELSHGINEKSIIRNTNARNRTLSGQIRLNNVQKERKERVIPALIQAQDVQDCLSNQISELNSTIESLKLDDKQTSTLEDLILAAKQLKAEALPFHLITNTNSPGVILNRISDFQDKCDEELAIAEHNNTTSTDSSIEDLISNISIREM